MANEIYISSVQALSISCQLYNGATAVGSPFLAIEIGTLTGEYVASMPASIPYGTYLILATTGADVKVASGSIYWDGNYEMVEGVSTLQGLNPANPSTTTQTTWNAGAIAIDITGDGINTTTMTRT